MRNNADFSEASLSPVEAYFCLTDVPTRLKTQVEALRGLWHPVRF